MKQERTCKAVKKSGPGRRRNKEGKSNKKEERRRGGEDSAGKISTETKFVLKLCHEAQYYIY